MPVGLKLWHVKYINYYIYKFYQMCFFGDLQINMYVEMIKAGGFNLPIDLAEK